MVSKPGKPGGALSDDFSSAACGAETNRMGLLSGCGPEIGEEKGYSLYRDR